MYLFSLESLNETATVTKKDHPSKMSSTFAPLIRLSERLSERRQSKSKSIFGEMQVTYWQPVVCGDLVVYVRRSLDD